MICKAKKIINSHYKVIILVLIISNLIVIAWYNTPFVFSRRDIIPNEEIAIDVAKAILSFDYENSINDMSFSAEYISGKQQWKVTAELVGESLGWDCEIIIRGTDGKVLMIKYK